MPNAPCVGRLVSCPRLVANSARLVPKAHPEARQTLTLDGPAPAPRDPQRGLTPVSGVTSTGKSSIRPDAPGTSASGARSGSGKGSAAGPGSRTGGGGESRQAREARERAGRSPDAGGGGKPPGQGSGGGGGGGTQGQAGGRTLGEGGGSAADGNEAPGLKAAFGRTRAAVQGLVSAHIELLKAELEQALREVAIIVGLAVVALVLALLMLILVWVGTWLFLGEWLFGSMGWGILHGTLITIALIVPIGLNLAGGSVGAWARAFVISLIVAILLSVLFASNVMRSSAVWLAEQLQGSLSFAPSALPTLGAAVVGALVLAVAFVLLIRSGNFLVRLIGGVVLGFILGAIFGSVTFDTKGAIAVALTVALIAWIALSAVLAVRRGIDPKARYEKLIPRASMAQFAATRAYLEQQWQRQRKKLSGR
jgi:hypothetical protein